MFRTATCGELRLTDANKTVTLAGWVQKVRNLGSMVFIDLRDRYGITQITVDEHAADAVRETAGRLGREYVIQVTGTVTERSAKNSKIPTGEIEIVAADMQILNTSEVPPFTIEEQSDGGDDLRMRYRYLDLRRAPLQRAMMLRHRLAQEVRNYLDAQGFMEIETPYLIKSTPEGARDFVVPSRMNPGEFYALPQSPQTFKQLLMVSGYDRLRADRQPEFTQVDCEMAFVEREDVLTVFEGMMRTMFDKTLGVKFAEARFPRMTWHEAMEKYGSDKPDIRFGMTFNDLTGLVKGHDFAVFDGAEYVGAICAPGCASYTRKQLDGLTEFVKRPQVGRRGWCMCGARRTARTSRVWTSSTRRRSWRNGARLVACRRGICCSYWRVPKNRRWRRCARCGWRWGIGWGSGRTIRSRRCGGRFSALGMGRRDAALLCDAPPVYVAQSGGYGQILLDGYQGAGGCAGGGV